MVVSKHVALWFTVVCVACRPSAPAIPGERVAIDDTLWAHGAMDGDATEVFGRIEAVAFDARGRLAVLDGLTHSLEVFGPEGRLLGTAGREGDGPGEWRWPADVAWLEPDTVLVLNAGRRRLTTYHASDDGLRFAGEVVLEEGQGVPRALCVLGDRIFISGYAGEALVRELARDGRPLRAFAAPGPDPDGISRRWLSSIRDHYGSGRLLCDAGARLVVMVPRIMPLVQAFRPDGTLAWRAELSDYRGTRFVELANGGLQLGLDPETGTAHQLAGAFVAEGALAVQLSEVSLSPDAPRRPVETRWIDLRTGAVLGAQDDLPAIGAADPARAALVRGTPFPRIIVATLR